MPSTDWNGKSLKQAKPPPRFGACLVCGFSKCGCWSDDVFGPDRDQITPQDATAAQPMLRLTPSEDMN